MQFLYGSLVVSKILLASNENDRVAGAEVKDLRDPLKIFLQHR